MRIDGDVAAASVLVDVEDLLPGLAAVGRAKDAALLVGVPQVAGGADEDVVTVQRIDDNPRDALAVRETDVLPVVTAVGALVDAVPHRHAVSRPALAGAHPDDIGVRRIDLDRAGCHRMVVEYRLERDAAVLRLPYTARRRCDVDDHRVRRDGVYPGNPPAHHRGPYRAGAHPGERSGFDLHLRLCDNRQTHDGHQQRTATPGALQTGTHVFTPSPGLGFNEEGQPIAGPLLPLAPAS